MSNPALRVARGIGVATALVAAAGCTLVGPKPELTPLELQALQTREFNARYPAAFSATLSVLQDLGYIVESADKEAGYITARGEYKPARGESGGGSLWGRLERVLSDVVDSSLQLTASVESIAPERARVRVNMIAKVTRAHETPHEGGVHSQRKTESFSLTEPERYQRFFERLDAALFIRRHSR